MWALQDDTKDNDDEQGRSLDEEQRPSRPAQEPPSAEHKPPGGAAGRSKRAPRKQSEVEPKVQCRQQGGLPMAMRPEAASPDVPSSAAEQQPGAPPDVPLAPGPDGDEELLQLPGGSKGSRRPNKRGRQYTSKGEVADLIGKVGQSCLLGHIFLRAPCPFPQAVKCLCMNADLVHLPVESWFSCFTTSPPLHAQAVDVPGWVFRVEVPQLFYPGRVLGPDHSHASSVVVKVAGDPTK